MDQRERFLIVGTLCFAALMALGGIILCASTSHEIPAGLWALAGTALGGLSGLADPHRKAERQGEDRKA
jgi:hypothetical protein